MVSLVNFRKQLRKKYYQFCINSSGKLEERLFPKSFTEAAAAVAAKSLQSCPNLCNTWDGSPPGSPVPGILQARTLEWVAISFSNAPKWKVKVKSLSHVWLLATPWTAAHQAPPSMGFSRQQYWSGHQALERTKYIYIILHVLLFQGVYFIWLSFLPSPWGTK